MLAGMSLQVQVPTEATRGHPVPGLERITSGPQGVAADRWVGTGNQAGPLEQQHASEPFKSL